MERREFLKFAIGIAAGATMLAATAQAAPLMPQPLNEAAKQPAGADAHPAVTSGDEVDRLKPEEVRWGHGHHHGWGHGHHHGWGRGHHWGWHRHRHWGWGHHHWRRHHWHHRHWRHRYW